MENLNYWRLKPPLDSLDHDIVRLFTHIYGKALKLNSINQQGCIQSPSLLQGSIQLVYITKFKPNVEESTVNISIHLAPAFNMDFDGDFLIIREC